MKFIETLKKIYLFYVYEHACMYMCVPSVCSALGGQKSI